MADFTIEKEAPVRKFDAEEQEHRQNIAENYRKLLDGASDLDVRTAERPAPAAPEAFRAPEAPAAPAPARAPEPAVPVADNSARIHDYKAYRVSEERHTLFDDLLAQNADLVMSVPAAEVYSAPVQPPEAAAAPVAEPESDEDARPTQRTMDTLLHASETQTQSQTHVGFFSKLSSKTKIALIAVIVAVVVALAIICINSNVISSMNARIGQEQASLDELVRQYEDVEQRIQNAIDPENVANWAQQNGMTKAD